jgi:hypothetical protein
MPIKIKSAIGFIQVHLGRLIESLNRARMLVSTYKSLVKQNPADESKYYDLLRAAVVFTHAALEDFLRSIASVYLPEADEPVLNNVPLSGIKGQAEKFYLGKLSSFRGMTIDDLIEQSVSDYLKRTTYNNTTDIITLSKQIGLDIDRLRPTFARLDQLMQRRHQIVHRCDRNKTSKGEVTQKISVKTVDTWINTVKIFGVKCVAQCISHKLENK